eukprot:gene758-1025_t
MGLRTVGADGLALTLPYPQRGDDHRPEEEHQQRRGEECRAGPEGDIAEQIEDLQMIRQIHQPKQHLDIPLLRLFWRYDRRKLRRQRRND